MLLIERRYIQAIDEAARREDLYEPLQAALELEHSTIPPYLTAMFSLTPGSNAEIRQVLRSVVLEEMLHLTIAANLLNALDGRPSLDRPDFLPQYPTTLPMNIGSGLEVGLEAYSQRVVHDVFMRIEQPETPQNFPVEAESIAEEEFATIGQFYEALIKKLRQLDNDAFSGDSERQLTDARWFPADELFAIHDVESAVRGIELIVEQGEGTKNSPLDPEGGFAHYYRFAELYHGRRLEKRSDLPEGYAYSGPEIPFDALQVYPLNPNTRVADLPQETEARRLAEQFNAIYSKLLRALDRAFDGEPRRLDDAMALMYGLKLAGERLATTPHPDREGVHVGPPFEYTAPAR